MLFVAIKYVCGVCSFHLLHIALNTLTTSKYCEFNPYLLYIFRMNGRKLLCTEKDPTNLHICGIDFNEGRQ